MTKLTKITVAKGDGIGPEIMNACLQILEAAAAPIEPEFITVGEQVYLSGNTSGIPEATWQSLRNNKILLKSPITTPQGGGYKSLNVTLRKSLDLYANVRPCKSFCPYVTSNHPDLDLVIVRENSEDLYTGIEHRTSANVYQTLKVVTREGCERIIRFAFEYAKRFNRRKVTCMSKDNIMKMTDGLFHKVFNEIAAEYSGFETEHQIIDIGTALIATRPERYDVIVTTNLYGDIISDVAAQVTGSVGLAGSANIGKDYAMFEAIHGSAPDIAGKNIANPSGLLQAAIQMLIYLGMGNIASTIQNAWLATLEAGIHTGDIYSERFSKERAGTDRFAAAVIERLGEKPTTFPVVHYQSQNQAWPHEVKSIVNTPRQQLVGIDLFIQAQPANIEQLAKQLNELNGPLKLITIANRGLKVWPRSPSDIEYCDVWCCRFQSNANCQPIDQTQVIRQLMAVQEAGFEFLKMENLYFYDDERGFSLAQGE